MCSSTVSQELLNGNRSPPADTSISNMLPETLDHPSNGIALCKNHHSAMDQYLIAPEPEGRGSSAAARKTGAGIWSAVTCHRFGSGDMSP